MSVQTIEYKNTLRARLSGISASLARVFSRIIESQSRIRQIESLNAKSDAELAKLGITRDRIPYHVFRDRAYL